MKMRLQGLIQVIGAIGALSPSFDSSSFLSNSSFKQAIVHQSD